MDKRHDTVLETLMEQLIEGGAENMGLVFARVFGLAMQIERKPDAVIPHVRFDERRLETELRRELRHRHRRKPSETVRLAAYGHRASRQLYWRAGFESGALRPMSCTRRASPCHVNIGAPRPTVSIPNS